MDSPRASPTAKPTAATTAASFSPPSVAQVWVNVEFVMCEHIQGHMYVVLYHLTPTRLLLPTQTPFREMQVLFDSTQDRENKATEYHNNVKDDKPILDHRPIQHVSTLSIYRFDKRSKTQTQIKPTDFLSRSGSIYLDRSEGSLHHYLKTVFHLVRNERKVIQRDSLFATLADVLCCHIASYLDADSTKLLMAISIHMHFSLKWRQIPREEDLIMFINDHDDRISFRKPA